MYPPYRIMGRRIITEHLFEKMVNAFRESPGNYAHAIRMTGVGIDLVRRAWNRGWPHVRNGQSVQDVFRDEEIKARANILAEQAARRASAEKDREDAKKQAIESRKVEGQMVALSRAGTVNGLAVVNGLLPQAKKLADMVKRELEVHTTNKTDMPPERAISLLGKIIELQVRLNGAAHESMQMERLYLGKPEQMIGIVVEDAEEMPMEELEVKLKAAQQAFEATKKAVGLKVINGGQTDSKLGTL